MSAQRLMLTGLLILALLAPGAAASGAPEPDRGLLPQTALELNTAAAAAATAYSLPDLMRVHAVDLERAAQVAAGGNHTCAVTESGGVKCWGYGPLGDGTTTSSWTPVDVSGMSSGVAAVTAGRYHTCALTTGGGVKCWGSNSSGQLGDGTTVSSPTPVDVFGLSSGVAAVAAGSEHTCALTTGGGVKCWGRNDSGQLGDGTTTGRTTPVDVSGLNSGVAAIAVGDSHTCAVTTGGGAKCWGANWWGQLGDGTTTGRTTPVDVTGLSSGMAAIAAGYAHTCAVTTGGGVKCWGRNNSGQLGDGTTTQRTTPVDVSGLSSGVAAVAADRHHTCALTTGGGIKCWGNNWYGQLGDGTANQRTTPVGVTGLSSDAIAVTAGWYHTCALILGGGVKCWGSNASGQLGAWTHRSTPTDVTGLSSGVVAVAAGGFHTCGLTTGAGVKCWGDNGWGELGNGTTTSSWTPVDVSGMSSGVAAVTAGTAHTCAVATGGGAGCWGWNQYGQLGDGTTTDRSTPVGVSGLYSGVAAIAADHSHTCVVTTGGGVRCWGGNTYGQLGDGTTTNRTTPVGVIGLSSGVAAVSAGSSHTCALLTTGGVKCWGWNGYGQLGDGTTTDRSTPVDVVGLGSGVAAIAAGGAHTCALLTTGGVKCWGSNWSGQLGDGTRTDRSTPVDVVGLASGAASIAAGSHHTCALLTAGGVKCWGYNGYGQLGDGTTTNRTTPVDVIGLSSGMAAVAAGDSHTCAFTTAGGVKCWGRNSYGQLGVDPGWTPVNVEGFGGDWTPAVLAPIEQPLAGAFVSNTVTLRGFAIDRASPTGTGIDMIHIYLDGPYGTGTIIGGATYGLDRPDVAAQYGARFGPSGWELAWNTTGLAPGVHRLYLYAHRTTDNAWSLMDPHLVVVPGGPARWLPIVLRRQ